jgi:hypothetical protein
MVLFKRETQQSRWVTFATLRPVEATDWLTSLILFRAKQNMETDNLIITRERISIFELFIFCTLHIPFATLKFVFFFSSYYNILAIAPRKLGVTRSALWELVANHQTKLRAKKTSAVVMETQVMSRVLQTVQGKYVL